MSNVKEDIVQIKQDVEYIKKMLEDFIMGARPKQNQSDVLAGMMDNFKTMINADPNLSKHPGMKDSINNLFKVKP